jgi:hypothetical protein
VSGDFGTCRTAAGTPPWPAHAATRERARAPCTACRIVARFQPEGESSVLDSALEGRGRKAACEIFDFRTNGCRILAFIGGLRDGEASTPAA